MSERLKLEFRLQLSMRNKKSLDNKSLKKKTEHIVHFTHQDFKTQFFYSSYRTRRYTFPRNATSNSAPWLTYGRVRCF